MAHYGSELNGDQKEAIVKLRFKGTSGRKIAELTDISRATIQKFSERLTRSHIENKPQSGRQKISGIRDDNALSHLVKRNRRQSLKDLTDKLNKSFPESVSKTTVKRKLKRLNTKDAGNTPIPCFWDECEDKLKRLKYERRRL